MRILIHSPSFFPAVGGVESVALLLARHFVELGHQIRVFTETPALPPQDNLPSGIAVIRSSSYRDLWREVRWCQGYLQMGLSLKGIYPLIFLSRAWVVSHHTWYTPAFTPLNLLKRSLSRFATNVYCSQAVSSELGAHGPVVGNPYDETIFHRDLSVPRRARSLVFVGRLVSDKGIDILLNAARLLVDLGDDFALTIVGDGPERETLGKLTEELQLAGRVSFAGKLPPATVSRILNAHQILVVPSRWKEPFGVVAVEGIACGCVVVGSQGGGLAEAIGPCGLTFPNGDFAALAAILHRLFVDQDSLAAFLANAPDHLARFRPERAASTLMTILQSGLGGQPVVASQGNPS